MRSGLSAFKGVVLFMGMALLTGAKTNGCGPDLGGGETDPSVECPDGFVFDGQACVPIDQPVCPEGTVESYVCAEAVDDPTFFDQGGDPTTDPGCWVECVPIDPPPVCPDGTMEQVICAGSTEPDPGMGGGKDDPYPGDPNDPVPPEEQCWTECVPIDPTCPPGYHEDYVCEADCNGQETCYLTCTPDCPEECPIGSHKETVCDEYGCYDSCIPDNQCPPGTHVEWTCPDGSDQCFEECVPDNICGPGSHVEYQCDDYGCWETCVPDDQCPPGTHLEVQCDDYGCYETCVQDSICPPGYIDIVTCDEMTGECYQECVPDQNGCPPGTELQTACDDQGNCYDICVQVDPPAPDPGQHP